MTYTEEDLKEMKKDEIIQAYMALQQRALNLKNSNTSFRANNTRLTNRLKTAQRRWNEWRDRYWTLKRDQNNPGLFVCRQSSQSSQ
jgi:hypothetical protein